MAKQKEPEATTPATAAESNGWDNDVSPLPEFDVEIPLCLLGVRRIAAESEEAAIAEYMRIGGIVRSERRPVVTRVAAKD